MELHMWNSYFQIVVEVKISFLIKKKHYNKQLELVTDTRSCQLLNKNKLLTGYPN